MVNALCNPPADLLGQCDCYYCFVERASAYTSTQNTSESLFEMPLMVMQRTYQVAGQTCGAVHGLQVQDVVTFCHRQTGASCDPSVAEHQRMVHEGQAELVRLREALTAAGGGSGCLECKDGSHRYACNALFGSPGKRTYAAQRACGTEMVAPGGSQCSFIFMFLLACHCAQVSMQPTDVICSARLPEGAGTHGLDVPSFRSCLAWQSMQLVIARGCVCCLECPSA